MAASPPAEQNRRPTGLVDGDDLVLAEAYDYLHDVLKIASGQFEVAPDPPIISAVVAHVPSWRGASDDVARKASDRLAERLVKFRRQAARYRLDAETANDIQFSLVCATDLILSSRPWAGRENWQASPLEHRLFDTTGGAARVIARAKETAAKAGVDALRVNRVNLLVLRAAPFGADGVADHIAAQFPVRRDAHRLPVIIDERPAPASYPQLLMAAASAVGVFGVASWGAHLLLSGWFQDMIRRMVGS